MEDDSKVIQLLTEIRDNQRAQMEANNAALRRSFRNMRIIFGWLLLMLLFLGYVVFTTNKRHEELKKQQQEMMGEFEA